jgi:hypothetical protein
MADRTASLAQRVAWRALQGLAALGLAGLWHALVLQRLRDGPASFAALLAGLFALAVAARALARRMPETARGASARRLARWTGADLGLVALALSLVFLFHWGYERAASDGREYYVQVRSLVIDGDLDFANDNAAFGTRGTARRYAFGAPLLWAPFFVACHLWLGLMNALGADIARDGFGLPYQRAVGLGTLVYGLAGLVLIFRLLADYFSRALSLGVTAVICYGSFIVWYLVVENSMVHGPSMFATTLFLYAWHRTRQRSRPIDGLAIGAAAGLMTLVRWQNAAFAVVPGVDLALRAWRGHPGGVRSRLRALAPRSALLAAGGLAAFAPQLVFWKLTYGNWWNLPSNEHGVDWTRTHIGDVLFSSNHGLLSSTPLLYVALAGVPLFARRNGWLTAALAGGFLAQLYVNSTVEVWWGGAGFGARRFENCALLFAVGLAAAWTWARRRPLVAPAAIAAGFLALNAAVMLDLRRGRWAGTDPITFDEMVSSLYARVGNPFSFPLNALVAWRHGVGLPFYDQLRGRTYNNLDIDVGAAGDERFLGPGWSARERNDAMSFRWADRTESLVVVPLKESDRYRLEIWCAPFTYPGAPPQTIDVVVNGTALPRIDLAPGMGRYALEVPAALVRPDLNQIRFRFAYATSPQSAGLSEDARPLAVLFDTVRLTRLVGR